MMSGENGGPLLVLDRVGKGRVAQLLSDQMWLWARGFEGGGPQAELLRRLAYWLMKEPDLEENDLRAVIEGDQLKVTRQSLEPDDSPVTVTAPDGTTSTLALTPAEGGRSTGTLRRSRRWGSTGSPTATAPRWPLPGRSTRSNSPMCAPPPKSSARSSRRAAAASSGSATDAMPDIRRVAPGRSAAGHGWLGLRAQRRLCRHRVQRDAAAAGCCRAAAGARTSYRRVAARGAVGAVIRPQPALPARGEISGTRAATAAEP